MLYKPFNLIVNRTALGRGGVVWSAEELAPVKVSINKKVVHVRFLSIMRFVAINSDKFVLIFFSFFSVYMVKSNELEIFPKFPNN